MLRLAPCYRDPGSSSFPWFSRPLITPCFSAPVGARGLKTHCGRSYVWGLAVNSMNPRNSQHPLARLEFTSRVRKRAEYEALEFSLAPGSITVRNESYADRKNHQYPITVRDGLPVAFLPTRCRRYNQRRAVAVRPPRRRPAFGAAFDCVGGRAHKNGGHAACPSPSASRSPADRSVRLHGT